MYVHVHCTYIPKALLGGSTQLLGSWLASWLVAWALYVWGLAAPGFNWLTNYLTTVLAPGVRGFGGSG